MAPLTYPMVECDSNPGHIEPGYAICEHVQEAKDVFYVEQPTNKAIGVVACKTCFTHRDDSRYFLFHFAVACASCLRRGGIITEGQPQ